MSSVDQIKGKEFDMIFIEEAAYVVDAPSDRQLKAVLSGKLCAYCFQDTEWIDSKQIYGTSYGMMYACKKCNAWVGVHHKTTRAALGRVANKELREWKQTTHHYFDQLWKPKKSRRTDCYMWLAKELNIDSSVCHIGMFNVDQCRAAVEIIKKAFPHLQ